MRKRTNPGNPTEDESIVPSENISFPYGAMIGSIGDLARSASSRRHPTPDEASLRLGGPAAEQARH